jgi:hypothetical protein
MVDPLARLKILINSSTPVVVIETVEETRAVRLIRSAADEISLQDPLRRCASLARMGPHARSSGVAAGREERGRAGRFRAG